MSKKPPQRCSAFTLVELLVVIGIIALLVAILMPSLNRARSAAAAVACGSNLHQIYLALANYAHDNRDYIPPNNTGAANWHYGLGLTGYFGRSQPAIGNVYNPFLGNTWPILRCPAEYSYQSNNGPVSSNYENWPVQTSYAMNWAYWYYKQWFPRKGFSKKPPGISRSKMAMVMDCPAYNIGWNAASFSWGTDINPWVYTPWEPYYPFRHPGKTANVAYMDGHVERVGSFAQGRGDPVYWPVYDTDPDGTPPSSGVAYAVYPY